MKIMIAYDGSRNAKLALAQTVDMFKGLRPKLLLIGVAEEPRDSTERNVELFEEEYNEVKQALEEGAEFVTEQKLESEIILAEGDPRKMILAASKRREPDLLVIARHSNKPDGGIIAQSLTYFVDEIDYMTFGSVSAFLSRRVECPLLIYPAP
ncbi:nucleotide-binding universal stress UspA family protein [Alkalispirillum mobile]|uniref:Nucleotide-binding universal stress UspA family protein n=1 Tax=Alkalispirillum mobile TaxID=85925 RepID=A0A498C2B9_9GAMM|nr:universal stress protein [Alkalispirillum mobile]RLK48766.1 nucleotide-binding universal stress UspA family protein [Alkalispirillum mobile]